MPVRRRWPLRIGLAIVLLAGLRAAVALGQPPARQPAQGPGEPWLLRWACSDEGTLGRLIAGRARLILWQGNWVYGLAGRQVWTELASDGLPAEVLARGAPQGDYFLITASPEEAQALGQRYGLAARLVEEDYYLLGLPPGAAPEPLGMRFVRRLPTRLQLPPRPSQAVLAPASPKSLDRVTALVSSDRLTADIASLQEDEGQAAPNALRSRYTLLPGLDAEAACIASQLQALGLQVSYFPFTASEFRLGVTRVASDIIASLPGQRPAADGFFVLCAHYDSTSAKEPDWYTRWRTLPAPGADDNGSGVAGLLEVARVLRGRPLAYEVRLAVFAGEEQGMQGSLAYVRAQQEAGARILGAIDLDMIAYDGNRDGRVELHAGRFEASQALAQVLMRNLQRYAPQLHPVIKTAEATDRSDHSSFWNCGYPAVLAIEDWDEFTPAYHTAGDTLDTLNLAYSAGIVRATVGALGELAGLQEPDLSSSQEAAAFVGPFGTGVSYTVTLRNSGGLAATATLTDVLRPELRLYGAPVASEGEADWDAATRLLCWRGTIAPQGAVTICYQATVDPWKLGGTWIRNTAQADDGAGDVEELPASVQVPWRWTLPLIRR